jgi:ubiquinone/menaquinone biosynthesis C-methylase UbiE
MAVAKAENLPFRDDVFDLVVAHFSVPMLCTTKREIVAALEEMCRVAKRGGVIRIVPVRMGRNKECDQWAESELSSIRKDARYRVREQAVQVKSVAFAGRVVKHHLWVIEKG